MLQDAETVWKENAFPAHVYADNFRGEPLIDDLNSPHLDFDQLLSTFDKTVTDVRKNLDYFDYPGDISHQFKSDIATTQRLGNIAHGPYRNLHKNTFEGIKGNSMPKFPNKGQASAVNFAYNGMQTGGENFNGLLNKNNKLYREKHFQNNVKFQKSSKYRNSQTIQGSKSNYQNGRLVSKYNYSKDYNTKSMSPPAKVNMLYDLTKNVPSPDPYTSPTTAPKVYYKSSESSSFADYTGNTPTKYVTKDSYGPSKNTRNMKQPPNYLCMITNRKLHHQKNMEAMNRQPKYHIMFTNL